MEPLAAFLRDLFSSGSVRVGPEPIRAAGPEALQQLAEEHQQQSLDAPGVRPEFSPEPAAWAALTFHHACRFLIFRQLGEDALKTLDLPCPAPPGPCAAWSADLVLRFLPDLHTQASRASWKDPLLDRILRLASEWPLSSVGIPGATIQPVDLDPITACPCLAALYVDRVLAADDRSRLGPPWVERRVREALGAYPELAPPSIRLALTRASTTSAATG